MAIMKTRVGGVWTNTNKKGSARLDGVTYPYAPSGPVITTESVVWPQEPAFPDNADGTQTYNMGIQFSLLAPKSGVGVRWRVPNTVLAPQGGEGHVASIWRVSDQVRIASKVFTPTPGVYQDVLFDIPPALAASTFYVAAIYTRSYVYRASSASVTSPSGNLTVSGGRLVPFNAGSNMYPDGQYNTWYYIAPIVTV